MRQIEMGKVREACEKDTKNYNKMLRWQEVETAGLKYMEPEQREAFMKSAEEMRKRVVTITDYRILTSECQPEKNSAEVLAEFDYYILPSNRIKTLTYRQQWVYHDEDGKKGWKLKTGLPLFE
ncbi:MAG TPA: hypothetical protein VGJ93_13405 [Desulfuromonadaceae bacterium]